MFHDLNDHYFSLFSDLDACRAVLPEKQYRVMSDALMEAYKRDLEVVVGQKQLDTARDVFELRFRLKNYVPRRSFLFWNKAAKAIRRDCMRAFRKYLAGLEAPPEAHQSTGSDAPEPDLPVPLETSAKPR